MMKGDAEPDHPERQSDPDWMIAGMEASYRETTPIPHYYGSVVRQFLVAGAALVLLGAPLYADQIKVEFPFEVAAAIIAVIAAAFTSPRKKVWLMTDAVISGVGAVVYAAWALLEYDSISPVAFILRIVIALICLFAFYFSLKTVRAFAYHQIRLRENEREDKSEKHKHWNFEQE